MPKSVSIDSRRYLNATYDTTTPRKSWFPLKQSTSTLFAHSDAVVITYNDGMGLNLKWTGTVTLPGGAGTTARLVFVEMTCVQGGIVGLRARGPRVIGTQIMTFEHTVTVTIAGDQTDNVLVDLYNE